ncbi:hypothetical protein QEN40_17305 [Gordonia alkanivorans]|uniref:hypothetical protein n=1 Tax=Gordonia alkanivorans TaxID=84096 RepID=UPI00244AC1A7|nr:hypothetical protein [Gordonia alkanivorans]MDH3017411.1 hypothetical protein [Gordonia alkanivorans]MDH3042729.1 hypothetical protein [Gordonia alkanivorans]
MLISDNAFLVAILTATVLCGAVAFGLCIRVSPRFAIGAWLISTSFIPYWIGVDVAGFLPLPTLMGFLFLVSMLIHGPRIRGLVTIDYILLALVGSCSVAVFVYDGNLAVWLAMLSHWGIAYLIARTAGFAAGLDWVGSLFAVTMSLVGALAIVERIVGWHPFTKWTVDNLSFEIWAPLLERAGETRSEWAFGHPIALGATLALATPFAIASRFNLVVRVAMLAVIGGGILTTGSRGAILAFACSFALSALLSSSAQSTTRTSRWGIVVVIPIVAATALAIYTQIDESGGAETANSSGYRMSMYSLLGTLKPLGRAASYYVLHDGTVVYGRYTSIDNTFIWFGLTFGFIPLAILVLAAVLLMLRVGLIRATVPEIAVAGNFPVILTVAPITQYQIILWFVVGLGVASWLARRDRSWSGSEGLDARVGAMASKR